MFEYNRYWKNTSGSINHCSLFQFVWIDLSFQRDIESSHFSIGSFIKGQKMGGQGVHHFREPFPQGGCGQEQFPCYMLRVKRKDWQGGPTPDEFNQLVFNKDGTRIFFKESNRCAHSRWEHMQEICDPTNYIDKTVLFSRNYSWVHFVPSE